MKSPDRFKERSGYAQQTAVYEIRLACPELDEGYGGVRGARRS